MLYSHGFIRNVIAFYMKAVDMYTYELVISEIILVSLIYLFWLSWLIVIDLKRKYYFVKFFCHRKAVEQIFSVPIFNNSCMQ